MEISNVTFQYMILAITLEAVLLVVVLLGVFASGVGKRVLQRIKQRWMYKWGKHANVVYIGNNHVGKEIFVKKEDDGSIEIYKNKYVINPLATFILDGIPTQIVHEGIAEPLNIFSDPQAELMSTAEIQNIILNNENKGIAEMMRKMLFWGLIALGVTIIVAGAAAYYAYTTNDYLVTKHVLANSVDAIRAAMQNATTSAGITPR